MSKRVLSYKFPMRVSLYEFFVLSLVGFFYFGYIRYLDESLVAYFSAFSHYVVGSFAFIVLSQPLYGKYILSKLFVLLLGYLVYLAVYIDSSLYRIMGIHINGYVLSSLMQEDAFTHIGIKANAGMLTFIYPVVLGVLPFVFYNYLIKIRIESRRWLVVFLVVLTFFFSDKVLYAYSYYSGKPYVFSISDTLPGYVYLHPYYSNKIINMVTGSGRKSFAEPSSSEMMAVNRETLYVPECEEEVVIKDKPNILLVIVESLRFNEVYSGVAPNIQDIGSKGLVFSDHYSSSNTTHFAIFSLLYGLSPYYFQHVRSHRITPLLSNILSDNGYELVSVLSRTMKWYDLDKSAFTNFEKYTASKGLSAWEADKWVVEKTTDIFKKNKGRTPTFMVSYLYSTHFDYQSPDGWAKFTPVLEGNINVADDELSQNRGLLLNRYKNSVSYVDFLLGKLVSSLDEAGVMENTILLITGDHGEEFFEEGHLGHNSKFNEYQTHVPMIFRVPGIIPREIGNLTSHVDVPITLLSLLVGNNIDGCSLQGVDMINSHQEKVVVAMAHYRRPEKYAILDGEAGLKIIINMEGRRPIVERVMSMDDHPLSIDPKKYSSEVWSLLNYLKGPE